MSMEYLLGWELAGETEVLGENLPNAILSTTNPTLIYLGSNMGRRGGNPALKARAMARPAFFIAFLVLSILCLMWICCLLWQVCMDTYKITLIILTTHICMSWRLAYRSRYEYVPLDLVLCCRRTGFSLSILHQKNATLCHIYSSG
jgi:hypothetical protein